MNSPQQLPEGVHVLERGWLSSNSILLGNDPRGAVLIDTGYCTHADQTAALVGQRLAEWRLPLRLIVNTHLHSDHCGGNARLSELHGCPIWIPPGDYDNAKCWDEANLSYRLTGQQCPRFTPDAELRPGDVLQQAHMRWEVHAAPGHDEHAVLLFERTSRTLISADALWEHGFGIVFPETAGEPGFPEVEATLELIEHLAPAIVIPGHGPVFSDIPRALDEANQRLKFFRTHPDRHARHAAKALIVFHMLEVRRETSIQLHHWLEGTPIHQTLHRLYWADQELRGWTTGLLQELCSAGVLENDGDLVRLHDTLQ